MTCIDFKSFTCNLGDLRNDDLFFTGRVTRGAGSVRKYALGVPKTKTCSRGSTFESKLEFSAVGRLISLSALPHTHTHFNFQAFHETFSAFTICHSVLSRVTNRVAVTNRVGVTNRVAVTNRVGVTNRVAT